MDSIGKIVAKNLLEIQAVKLDTESPFNWASGWKSPIYTDNRKILSYPDFRTAVCDYMVEVIKTNFADIEVIAGVATGAIAYGAIIAEKLGLPFVYIRPKAKDHGMCNQIEGVNPESKKVVVIEDLISTGMSSLAAVDALRKNGAFVSGMVAIFSYNFDKSRQAFERSNVELHTLSNYNTLIEEALEANYIKPEDINTLEQWRFSPETWGSAE